MRDVTGKVAVITGGASGIGRGMAEAFAAAGMKLVLADVDEARALSTAEALTRAGAEAIAVRCDVSSQDELDSLARRARDAFGAVHVVCNNAGVAHGGVTSWESSLAEWQWVVGVNFMGVVHGVRTFAPLFVEQNAGHIVNTASLAGLITNVGGSLYGATKHAVVSLSESLFGELRVAAPGVHVSVLCPAFVATDILESSERHAPRGVPSRRDHPRHKTTAAMIAGGLSPTRVGEQVLAAIREERFWVLPHPEFKPSIRHRVENVLEERDPTPFRPWRQ
jgi:NAD(P)-dependent dehydrogenase (short-subunit alcohol dehydrogenase family)